MKRELAKTLLTDTFDAPFDERRFNLFTVNLLNEVDTSKGFPFISGNYIRHSFKNHISKYRRLGCYTDNQGETIDILVVKLKNDWALERSRTMLRNFTADYLENRDRKDAALVAYYTNNPDDWRFSYIRMDYKQELTDTGKIKVRKELTPACRYSFLVGVNEPNHTAQAQLLDILEDDKRNPTLSEIENAFSVDAVTKQFYMDYRDLFDRIHKELDGIVGLDVKVAKEFKAKLIETANFAKKLMGQIIFLYFLQKKGWLGVGKDINGNFKKWGTGPKNFLRRLYDKEFTDYGNFFNDVLEPLFYEALAKERVKDLFTSFNCKIPFLNGGLFDPMNDYNWVETEIRIDNELLSNVLATFDQYNFTVREDEPLEKEVAIDPEMLGKVFENLLPENLRKGKGAYYTPRTIVHYMCQESLINYLDTACKPVPKADIETLIREGDIILELETAIYEEGKKYTSVLMDSIKDNAQDLDDALANIKVCDPAIGSGAFPVGMLNEIVKARRVLELYLEKEETTYTLKRHCIQESIYGVDIDPGAIDIAKLRLWLSLVVDENDYSHIQALPNLDYKIMQGNSLIEEFHGISLDIERKSDEQIDAFSGGLDLDVLIEDLHDKQQDFFNAVLPQEKRDKRQCVESAIYDIFHHELAKKRNITPNEILEIESDLIDMTHGNKVRNFFPWKLYFADVFRENGGFDVMIANPPYIQLQKSIDEIIKTKYGDIYKHCNYKTFKRTGDIYVLFYELGIDCLKDQGHLTYITSSKWMRSGYGDVLRGYFSKLNPKILLDFPRINVFDSATVDVNILVIEKNINQNKLLATHFRNDFHRDDSMADYFKSNEVELHELNDDIWFIGNQAEIALKKKIEDVGTPLKDWDMKINYGIKTGYNDAFIIDEKKRTELIAKNSKSVEIIKPILRGRDIKRYGYEFAGLYLIDSHNGYSDRGRTRIAPIQIDKYPAIKVHLEEYWNRISVRQDQGVTPYNLRNCAYYPDFDKEKVVWIELVDQSRFCIVPAGMFTLQTTYMFNSNQVKVFTGILNSSLINWYFDKICAKSGVGTNRWLKIYVEQIPVVKFTPKNSSTVDTIYKVVDKILSTKKADQNADTTTLESEIDQLVSKLYGLTKQEIKIVAESVRN
jgi:hypothetical protein